MSYDRFLSTYRKLRREHRNNPDALVLIDRFGLEVAQLRILDEESAAIEANMVIELARRGSQGCG